MPLNTGHKALYTPVILISSSGILVSRTVNNVDLNGCHTFNTNEALKKIGSRKIGVKFCLASLSLFYPLGP